MSARPAEVPVVRLKVARRTPHPWIWRRLVEGASVPRGLAAGAEVRVVDGEGAPVGRGVWHPRASIAVRILSRDPDEALDAAYVGRRLGRALALRRDVLAVERDTDAWRLCHGEADGVSGLVVDVLGPVVAVEVFGAGVARRVEAVREALAALLPDRRVVARPDAHAAELEGFDVPPRRDDPAEVEVTERGLRYVVDLRHGHKTGFFCDQRENRALLAGLCRGKVVLDCHTYTGGFALNAARGEAAEVTGVDLDERAVAAAQRNQKRNQVPGKALRFVQADAFAYLRELARQGKRPDVLVLDPPKLGRGQAEREDALRAYGDLNRLGLEALGDEGLLLTCSCSGAVSEDDLLDALGRAAAKTRREVTVLRTTGAAPDHPWALHAPEGRYLKAIFARVARL